MRLVGFFLMLAGWVIAVTALLLLRSPNSQGAFAGIALAIQALGIGFIARTHLLPKGERHD